MDEVEFLTYNDMDEQQGLAILQNRPSRLIAVNVETISITDRWPIGIAIAPTNTEAFYFPLLDLEHNVLPWSWLSDPTITKVFHNAGFDLPIIHRYWPDLDIDNIHDTMLDIVLSEPERHWVPAALDQNAGLVSVNGVYHDQELLKNSHAKDMQGIPTHVLALNSMKKAIATRRLMDLMDGSYDPAYMDIELQVLSLFARISSRGIRLDQDRVQAMHKHLSEMLDIYRQECRRLGFNPGSPQQVAYMLSSRGYYLPFTRNPKGIYKNLSTDEDVLDSIPDPLAKLVLAYRHFSKWDSTYVEPLLGKERAYTTLRPGPITGRASSSQMNLQNVPVQDEFGLALRSMFLPDEEVFTNWDYSQAELRTLAHFSQDQEMLRIFSLPRFLPDGSVNPEADIHTQTARRIRRPRRVAKTINFAIVYGSSAATLAKQAKAPVADMEEAMRYWMYSFPGAAEYIQDHMHNSYIGRCVRTLFGRPMYIPAEMNEQQAERDVLAPGRKAIDYPIQGTVADIVKRAMLKVKNLLQLLQVHDSILFNGRQELPPELEWIGGFYTPMDTEELERWK